MENKDGSKIVFSKVQVSYLTPGLHKWHIDFLNKREMRRKMYHWGHCRVD